MLETMHACRIGVLGFMNHKFPVRLIREEDIQFGAAKEHFEAVMLAEVQTSDILYKIIIQPLHFCNDERIVTKSEHQKNIESMIERMKRLLYHYNHMKQVHSGYSEELRFLVASENLQGMNAAVKIMNKHKEFFSEKVFFTTDRVLRDLGRLADSVVAAKEVPDREGDSTHLGLVRLSKDRIVRSGNKWLLEDSGSM